MEILLTHNLQVGSGLPGPLPLSKDCTTCLALDSACFGSGQPRSLYKIGARRTQNDQVQR